MFSRTDTVVILVGLVSALYLKLRQDWEGKPPLKVKKIFIYPIKSLPPISVAQGTLDERGFEFDRRFMLMSPLDGGKIKWNLVSNSPQNTRIIPSIKGTTLTLTSPLSKTLSVPLYPLTDGLKVVEVDLYNSKVESFDMGEEAGAFFSEACGMPTRLMYIGKRGSRPVLGSMGQGKDPRIAYNDHGSFMVATTSSLNALSKSLGRPMDIIPLRPNILLEPASFLFPLREWVEDYWAELRLGEVSMRLTSNCVRCVSLNIDYSTGKFLEGNNLPLKALSKDRRVDTGSHSPVFGRYGFSEDSGKVIKVGDRVWVRKVNEERTTFDWPY
ncbi:hypothetical protein T439DRAFT_381973 [Meredithblackwellia eburnea MCA 4105]